MLVVLFHGWITFGDAQPLLLADIFQVIGCTSAPITRASKLVIALLTVFRLSPVEPLIVAALIVAFDHFKCSTYAAKSCIAGLPLFN